MAATTNPEMWEIRSLKLRPGLVWTMALSSLRVRVGRTFLTFLTISVVSAFLAFLLSQPRGTEPAEREMLGLMIVLGLLVSAAGVWNAMLMSVTQRYREIGTMKCLGALDRFILFSVMLEAALLGMAGALVGLVLGVLAAFLFGLIGGLGEALGVFSPDRLVRAAVFSVLAGIVLTALGAAVPAFIASRMPPIEAMRGEK